MYFLQVVIHRHKLISLYNLYARGFVAVSLPFQSRCCLGKSCLSLYFLFNSMKRNWGSSPDLISPLCAVRYFEQFQREVGWVTFPCHVSLGWTNGVEPRGRKKRIHPRGNFILLQHKSISYGYPKFGPPNEMVGLGDKTIEFDSKICTKNGCTIFFRAPL